MVGGHLFSQKTSIFFCFVFLLAITVVGFHFGVIETTIFFFFFSGHACSLIRALLSK